MVKASLAAVIGVGDVVGVELLAVRYDWDGAARRAEEVGFNAAWPHVIRTGLLPESA